MTTTTRGQGTVRIERRIAEVLANVESLVPELRRRAADAEQARDAIPETLAMLEDAGVYQFTAPREYGGLGANLDDRFDVLHAIARADPSLAWLVSLQLDSLWLTGTFPDEFQDELFSDPHVRLCGALAPTGEAVAVEGGYRVSGRWDFHTGSRHATWQGITALLRGDGAPPEAVRCWVPRSEVKSLDTWDPIGMAGTGSCTTVAEDVFVPTGHAMRVSDLTGGEIASVRHRSDLYYQVPIVQYILASFTGVLVGTARGAMEVFLERLPGRGITYTDWSDQRLAPLTHSQVGKAELDIQGAELYARKSNATIEAYRGRDMPLDLRVRTRAFSGRVGELSRSATQQLFEASGATAIQRKVPIQRYFRDITAIVLHGLIQPTSNTELYGRVAVGLEPNMRMV